MRTSVKFRVIYKHRDKYSISEMCRFFKVSRSGYYDFMARMDIPDRDLPLAEKIEECQKECGKTYGYRRVHIWLENRGICLNPKTVLRVMNKYNLLSVVRRRKYRNYGNYIHRYPRLPISHIFTLEKVYCIFRLSEICLTTVLLLTKPAEHRIFNLF